MLFSTGNHDRAKKLNKRKNWERTRATRAKHKTENNKKRTRQMSKCGGGGGIFKYSAGHSAVSKGRRSFCLSYRFFIYSRRMEGKGKRPTARSLALLRAHKYGSFLESALRRWTSCIFQATSREEGGQQPCFPRARCEERLFPLFSFPARRRGESDNLPLPTPGGAR